MASQDARLSKFESDFKQQQSEMTNKIDTVLKAITDRIAGTLPSDMVKNLKMMKGFDIGIQEKKAKLFNEWEMFASTEGESIESYYHRLLKLMNDLKRNKHFPEKIATPHQDQPSFNQNYMKQPMPNPEDITDPTTAINMALSLMAKAFKLNYSTQTNNNQRISSNPSNRQISQPGMNMGQDRHMQMVEGNGENQFRQYAGQNVRNLNWNCTVRLKRRDAAYLQTQLLMAQKEDAGIQLQAEEFDLMAATTDIDEIQEVNANCILMANLQQASTSSTQTDKAPVYDSDGLADVHDYENCSDNEIFNMFTQEEQYTKLLEPIYEPQQVPQNDNNVISEVTSVELSEETVEQHPANFVETRALYDSLYQNLAIEVEKVNTVNHPEQAFVEYASSRTNEAGGKWYTFKPKQNNLGDTSNPSWRSHPNLRSAFVLGEILPKMEDPRVFTLPCRLGDSEPFDTLADLGSCVNIIPLYLFKKLNIGLLEETDHIFSLANGTKFYSVRIVKDVEVHIGKLKLLNDFYVINMKKDPETPLIVGTRFLAITNAVIDYRMAKIAVGEGITRESYKPRPSSDGVGARTPYYARKDFLDCHFPREWEIAKDVELNRFKDTLVFRRMVEFLGAIPINLKSNMWESDDLIKNLINWDKPPKNRDRAWHAKIRLFDPDGEEFTKTPQSIPTTRKLFEIGVQGKSSTWTTSTTLDK
nr:hypothetical protein [Tanacetum cinerariifolium]